MQYINSNDMLVSRLDVFSLEGQSWRLIRCGFYIN